MRFQLVGLSTPLMPTLCLEDSQMGDETIYPELLSVGVVRWNKLPGCWQPKYKKNSLLRINNYLLKHNGVTKIYVVPSISFQTLFVLAFKIVVDSWTFSMLLLYILWDDWLIFMISGSNKQLQQQLEYTLLKPDCHSWWN